MLNKKSPGDISGLTLDAMFREMYATCRIFTALVDECQAVTQASLKTAVHRICRGALISELIMVD